MLVQPNGSILVGGVARQGQNKAAPYLGALVRFTCSGILDSTFGSGGQVLSASLGSNISALGLDAAGDIFVLPADADLSPAGRIDASVMPAAITASSAGGHAAFVPSGQYVIGESVGVGKHDVEVQVKYFNADGSLAAASPEFHYTGTTGEDGASGIAVQPNGQAVVGGSHFLDTAVFGLDRVNTNGSPDTTFGTDGTITTDIQDDDAVGELVIQPNGDIVAAGASEDNSTGQVGVALPASPIDPPSPGHRRAGLSLLLPARGPAGLPVPARPRGRAALAGRGGFRVRQGLFRPGPVAGQALHRDPAPHRARHGRPRGLRHHRRAAPRPHQHPGPAASRP